MAEIRIEDFDNDVENHWCPGCPNFGILQAFKEAFVRMGKAPHEICMISGIGQAAKLPHYLKCNVFNGLHGRALPVATGFCAANPDLLTVVVTGDGDCYGEGGNHFLHTLRRNPDLTVVVHNNEIYALTKGQASPTTPLGEKRSLQVKGVDFPPLNMPAVAVVHGCGFVARSFAGDRDHLRETLVQAMNYRGFSYVEVIQPCITWGTHPVQWYKDRLRKLPEGYDAGDRKSALEVLLKRSEEIPIGILYREEGRETFGHRYRKEVWKRPLAELKPLETERIAGIIEVV